MFRGPKLLWTRCSLKGGDLLVERRAIQLHTVLQSTLALTHGANSVPIATKQNYARGRVNHVTLEEARDVVLGISFINDTSAVVLLDSGTSHSFISAAYVEQHNLPIALLKSQMIVSSPRGDIPARQLCPKLNLKIRG
jgi:hypothetical protein